MIETQNSRLAEILKICHFGQKGEIEFDIIEHFRIHCAIKYTDETVRGYVNKIKEFEKIAIETGLIESISDFNKTWDYQKYRPILLYFTAVCQDMGNKPQTVIKKFEALQQLFLFLKDRDIVSVNPIGEFRDANLKFYKIHEEERQAVPIEKIEEIITDGSVQTKHWRTDEICPFKTHLIRTCYLVLAKDLLRSGEFCALNIGNFYLQDKYFVTGSHAKVSGKRRPLDDQTIWHLRVYWWIREHIYGEELTPESPAFLGLRYKSRMHKKTLLKKTKESASMIGIHEEGAPLHRRFTPHNFRHSGTTILADTEIKETYIVEIRGDVHLLAMDRYHHISTEKLIAEYLKHMPTFRIGESPADVYYMKAIDEAMKKEKGLYSQ